MGRSIQRAHSEWLTIPDLDHLTSIETMHSSAAMKLAVACILLMRLLPINAAKDAVSESTSPSPMFLSLNVGSIRKGQSPKTDNPSASPTTMVPLLRPSSIQNVSSTPTLNPSFVLLLEDEVTYQPSSHPSLSSIDTLPSLEHTAFDMAETPSAAPTSHPSATEIEQNPSEGATQTLVTDQPTNSPSIYQKQESDVESLEFYRNQLFSPICTIFFPDESILDEQSVRTFEANIENFVAIHSDEVNLPVVIVDIKGVTVVSQVLSWKRPSRILRSESAATGLDVYFRIDVVATGYATKEELEYSFQELFDSSSDMFQSTVGLNAIDASPLNSTQLTLVVVAGCSGFVAIFFTISMFVRKKNNGDTQAPSPNPVKKQPKTIRKTEYPIQESRQLALDNVSPKYFPLFI